MVTTMTMVNDNDDGNDDNNGDDADGYANDNMNENLPTGDIQDTFRWFLSFANGMN